MAISDEELKGLLFGSRESQASPMGGLSQSIPQQQVQAQPSLQPSQGISDDELRSMLMTPPAQTQGAGLSQFNLADIGPKASPLNPLDRVVLSFADDDGKERVLREKFRFVEKLPDGKFAVGNDQSNIVPVDPSGLFNDVIGDLADVASEIPVIAGQIAGAIAGTAAQPGGGTIVGAGIGSGLGESAKQLIGKGLGVSDRDVNEAATDIALSTAFGATGEGLGQLAKFGAGKVMSKFIAKGLDKGLIEAPLPQQSKLVDAAAKFFKITANVPEDATRRAASFGFQETFKPQYLDENFVVPLSNKIVSDVTSAQRALGDRLNNAAANLVKKTGNRPVLDLTDTVEQLRGGLKEIGVLNTDNTFNENNIVKGSGVFKKLLKQMESPIYKTETKYGQFGREVGKRKVEQFLLPKEKFTVSELLNLKRQAGDAFDSLAPQGQKVLFNFIHDFDEFTGQPTRGLSTKLAELAGQLQDNSYLESNKYLGDFLKIKDTLKKSGVDLTDTVKAQQSIRNLGNQVPAIQDAFIELDKLSPNEKFADETYKYITAQNFKKASPDLLRVGAVLSYAGMGKDDNFPGGKVGKLGLGLALTTPLGARMILKNSERLIGLANRGLTPALRNSKELVKTFRGMGVKEVPPAILSRMLQKSTESNSGRRTV